MDQTPPIFVTVFFSVIMIATIVAMIALVVSGLLIPIRNIEERDDDDERGGDEGFTPDPWGPSGTYNPIEQHDEELICQ